ncbi:MAG TPA: hypothetical protein VNN09_09930, partial [Candidatus Competibacteraceae bacterium]|nr:hypothetical protein [Candidatus Competibacteraceae bacterium]
MSRWLWRVQLVAALALGGLLAYELSHPPTLPPLPAGNPAPVAGGGALALPPLKELPPLSAYQEIVERPLFLPDRRPPAEEPPPPEPVAEEGEWLLQGVMITEDVTVALIQPQGGEGKTLLLRVGDNLDSWSVESIAADQVVLSREDGESRTLPLLRNQRQIDLPTRMPVAPPAAAQPSPTPEGAEPAATPPE